MGLGLAVADRLVRLMGGEIEVDSASGQGSTFWFLLPVEMPVTRPLSRAADKAASGPHATLQRTTSRLIDHDYLYELERDMGPDDASDRMVDALTNILSLYEGIAKAGNEGDHENLADPARFRPPQMPSALSPLPRLPAVSNLLRLKRAPTKYNACDSALQKHGANSPAPIRAST